MSPGATSWAAQILSKSVVALMIGAAPRTRWPAGPPPPFRGSRSGGADRRRRSRCRPSPSSWTAPSTCRSTVPDSTTAVSRAPGSCIGGSPGPPVCAAGRERVAGDLGALAGQRRRQDLVAVVAGRRPCGARARRTIDTAPSSSSRRSWESRSSRPPAMRAAVCSVGLVSPRSTCESIGRRDAGALREVAQRQATGLAQRLHARAHGRDERLRSYGCTLSRTARLSASTLAGMNRPDVLVLGGGGVLGEAWLRSALAGLEAGTAGTCASATLRRHLGGLDRRGRARRGPPARGGRAGRRGPGRTRPPPLPRMPPARCDGSPAGRRRR